MLCSHANCRLLFKRFNEVCKAGDEKMSEMLAHDLALHTRMHNQVGALGQALAGGGRKGSRGGWLGRRVSWGRGKRRSLNWGPHSPEC